MGGVDSLTGLGGDDTLTDTDGGDTLNGGTGTNTFIINDTAANGNTIIEKSFWWNKDNKLIFTGSTCVDEIDMRTLRKSFYPADMGGQDCPIDEDFSVSVDADEWEVIGPMGAICAMGTIPTVCI